MNGYLFNKLNFHLPAPLNQYILQFFNCERIYGSKEKVKSEY